MMLQKNEQDFPNVLCQSLYGAPPASGVSICWTGGQEKDTQDGQGQAPNENLTH